MPNTFKGGMKTSHRRPLPQSSVEYLAPEKISLLLPAGAVALVRAGESVSRGDIISEGEENILCPVSGTVSELRTRDDGTLITVTSDGLGNVSDACGRESGGIKEISSDGLRASLERRGIYLPRPTRAIEHLVINCCEPCSLSSSAALAVSEYYKELVGGASVIMKALGVRKALFALPRSLRDCEKGLLSLLRKKKMMSLAHVSDKYPQGNARMLISSLFNLEINIGTDPLSIGYAVIDAELCVKAFEALANGSPATYSFLTLNEEDIFVSHDICAPHGSSVSDILLHFGIEPESVFLIMKNGKAGGKYISLTDNIGTDTHSLTLFRKSEERRTEECIGCGRCNDVCPSKILPSLIYEYGEAGSLQTCAKLNVLCCIDCFCCNEVCPSGIPLAESMLEIKKRLEPCGEVSK